MKFKHAFFRITSAVLFGVIVLLSISPISVQAQDVNGAAMGAKKGNGIKRVLLISIDGMHAVDLQNFVNANPQSTLAQLKKHGITYTNASTSHPSDSFPGLLAQVTGGSTISTGVWYDDSYDRTLSPPGSHCATVGTEVVYDESIDKDSNAIDGGAGGGKNIDAIDPTKLPLDPNNRCNPVYPHSYLRVNTIFEVIKAAGGRTAWSDKHPAYDIVNGPSGKGVDDLYNPEIAANGDVTTIGVAATEAYDDLKVQAVINEIDGLDHTGTRHVGVPKIFGMNFQAVSVGQKFPGNGYTDSSGTPSSGLMDALNHTDQSIGKMVQELQKQGLFGSTLIIVSAKHGQSPIDPSKSKIIDKNVIPNLVNGVESNLLAQATQDDISLLWLTDQSRTTDVVSTLSANQTQAGIQEIYSGESLKLQFNDPKDDPRVPDIIVQPNLGVIYTKTTSTKIAEHGGFSDNDTNVALLITLPSFAQGEIKTPVQTTQIAPTILTALGLNPQALEAVQIEHTSVLPGLNF
ncbi:MAG: alkaline phosphatase family protein [Ignavibacteriales bacterium]